MSSLTPSERLKSLQSLLAEQKLDAYIVPSADAHQSEYVAERDMRRGFISGFDGSAGNCVITPSQALLWTDGRYFLQAEQQLSKAWTLMKQGVEGVPKLEDWVVANSPVGGRVGVDPFATPLSQFTAINELVNKANKQLSLVTVGDNLVDKVWGAARPAPSDEPLIPLPLPYTGQSTADKVRGIRDKMRQQGCFALVLCALDDVAWLLNARGADIPFNPLFFAYAVVTLDDLTVYVEPAKISDEVKQHLGSDVAIRPYDSLIGDLSELNKRLSALHASASGDGKQPSKVWLDPHKTNVAVYQAFHEQVVHKLDAPVALLKSVKNQAELDGMRHAHVRDGVAMVRFLHWLDKEVARPGAPAYNEVTAADQLESFRREQKDFVGLSFPTISGSGPNGAIIHYRPMPESAAPVDSKQLYLVDSGAQYRDGTTDVTRTLHLGTPSDFEREAFTRVLQGHIALARAVFPQGTVGPTLDILARSPLWRLGLDYLHGTGHGVGAFLNVHEGPQGISSTIRPGSLAATTALQPGMTVTNEPGYYHDGHFGIRIETVLIVVPSKTQHQFNGKQFLEFETITLVPIQHKMIKTSLLSSDEVAWLNDYHRRCFETLAPLLTTDEERQWLKDNTQPISIQA